MRAVEDRERAAGLAGTADVHQRDPNDARHPLAFRRRAFELSCLA
jgi:hypothetical protein